MAPYGIAKAEQGFSPVYPQPVAAREISVTSTLSKRAKKLPPKGRNGGMKGDPEDLRD